MSENNKKEKKEIIISENRDFKGVWIPERLYLTREFTPNEKFVLIEIYSLTKNKSRKCFASNKHFADFVGLKENTVQKMMLKFENAGYLKRIYELKENSKEIEKRVIILTDKFYDLFINENSVGMENNQSPGGEKSIGGDGKKSTGEVDKKSEISNTSIKYNSNLSNTNLSNTDNKAFSKEKVNYKDYKALFEKRVARDETKLPYNYNKKEFDDFIREKVNQIITDIDPEEISASGKVSKIISAFYDEYVKKRGERHPILSDAAYTSVVIKLLQPIQDIIEKDYVLNVERYQLMIERFFDTDYGKHSGNRTDYRISYFFQDAVQRNLMYKTEI